MTLLKAQQFLANVSSFYERDKKTFSRQEIVQKLNQIKYLSAQKQVPKLTLRKEILHLEQQLEQVAAVERKFTQRKTRESAKIMALKRRIASLEKQLAVSRDKHLVKKVEKLSHLLGECLAKKKVHQEVHSHTLQRTPNQSFAKRMSLQRTDRRSAILQRLEALKKELQNKDPATAMLLQEKIRQIEIQLGRKTMKKERKQEEAASGEPTDISHTLLFTPPAPAQDQEEESPELPLPPPPKE